MFGIKWQPFKKPLAPKFDAKSLGFMDLVSAALLASGAAGGLKGMGSLKNYSLDKLVSSGAIPKIVGGLGVLQGAGGSKGAGGSSGATGSTGGVNGMISALEPAAIQELLRAISDQQRRYGSRDAAINSLEPSTLLASAVRGSRDAGESYARQGERMAGRTNNRSLGDAFRLQASNQGTEAGNRLIADALDPARVAANRMQQMNLMQPNLEFSSLLSSLQGQQFSQNMANEQMRRSKPPGMLENVLGSVLPAAASQIDWKKVFKF
jgi:hypothetical protein